MNPKENRRRRGILFAALAGLAVLLVMSLLLGAVSIPWKDFQDVLFHRDSGRYAQIFYYVRLPRTLAAVLTGGALALSGCILQTVLHNPMCSPGIIGVNAGAGLFMLFITALFPAYAALGPVAAFLGALGAVLSVYLIARKTGASRLAIVLSGIAVSSLFGAFTDVLLTLVPDAKVGRVDFLIGSFSGVTMNQVKFASVFILAGMAAALLFSMDLNLLSLGDSGAHSLGLPVQRARGIFLAAAALLAGGAVSLAGLVGFVGLIVPHVARALVGQDNRWLLPLSVLLGGGFCLGCDILARVLFIPYEIPVGIVMSLLGSPFFIFLILRRKREKTLD